MSLAENLLNSLDETAYQNMRIAGGVPEEHIKVGQDRVITVPNSLKTIAVKGDKDVETATVDCVRYWDGNDLSTFAIYLNYILPNGDEGTYIPESITKSEDTFSFDWKIGSEFTYAQGKLTFWIVTKLTDADGELIKQWSSFQNSDCTVAQGGDKIYVPEKQTDQDVISHAISISRESAEIAEQQANLAKQAAVKAASDARDSAEAEVSRIIGELGVVQELGNSPNSVVSQAKVTKEFVNANDKINRNSKRLTNIEQGLMPYPFETDNGVAHVKYVPSNALPFAEFSMVGGMTYKDETEGTLKSAKVTGLKIVGANLLNDTKWLKGISVINGTKTITDNSITVASSGDEAYTNYSSSYAKIFVEPSTTYVLAWETTGTTAGSVYVFFNGSPTGVKSALAGAKKLQFTTPANCNHIFFRVGANAGQSVTYSNIRLNHGDTVLPYSMYGETMFTVPDEVQDLDGYGEGVSVDCYNYIDWEKKQFVKRVGKVDMGTLRWNYYSSEKVFAAKVIGIKGGKNTLCVPYPSASSLSGFHATETNIMYAFTSYFADAINIKDSTYTDSATFKAAMSGVMLYYELATPETTDISDLITSDNMLEVNGNGVITFENEHGLAVPSDVTYQLKGVTA